MHRELGSSYQAPSGRLILPVDIDLLIALERNKTIEWSDQEVTFNSGFKSLVYFRGRNDLTDYPILLQRVGRVLMDKINELPFTHGQQKCLVGIPTAGTPLAQVVASLSIADSRMADPIAFRIMRSVLKVHGKDNMWVGKPELERHSYITVENIVSTAKAMLQNFEHLEADGYPTRDMFHVVFASWDLGGFDNLAEQGYDKVVVLFSMLDIIATYVHIGLWPQERYDEMDRRIKAWRAQQT
jgi:orotate phosphoribosyltransferase